MNNKVLVILGNGFDLNCGLQSSYKDFFNYQMAHHNKFNFLFEYLKGNPIESFAENSIDEIVPLLSLEDDLSFFDLYFLVSDWENNSFSTDQIWSSIEDVLLSGVKSTSDSISFDICYSALSSIGRKEYYFYYQGSPTLIILSHYLYLVFKGNLISKQQYHGYLIKELNKFSVSFAKYINEQANSNADYIANAQKLLSKITGVALNECKIISFNYTDPFMSPDSANIHGLASKEDIVFGIACDKGSGNENSHYNWGYKMSKEYKIALIMSKGQKVSLDYRGVKDIYVYGLSLGEQDYDFFENLFDRCEFLMRLYEAKIHFCYSVYGNKTLEEVAEEATERVTNIINKFGDSHNTHGLLRSMIQNGGLDIRLIK